MYTIKINNFPFPEKKLGNFRENAKLRLRKSVKFSDLDCKNGYIVEFTWCDIKIEICFSRFHDLYVLQKNVHI